MKLYGTLVPNNNLKTEWFAVVSDNKKCLKAEIEHGDKVTILDLSYEKSFAAFSKVYSSNKGNAKRAMKKIFQSIEIEWLNWKD